jgi:hypothetical protein
MGKSYVAIDDKLARFIRAQKMFFVATAPSSQQGHVNVSPKGYDSQVILDPNTVAYIDLGGSGIETMAHVRENGRITLMFCAYEGKPNIMRLYGKGEAFGFDDPGFDDLMAHFPQFDRARGIIKIHVERVSDSCGWGIPFYEYKGDRDQLRTWVDHKPLEAWKEHRYVSNAKSIDGLPGLTRSK